MRHCPPTPSQVPGCPAPFLFRETLKPRFRMFLSVSIAYLQPPCHPPLFYLVSEKKSVFLKSQSLHLRFEFHTSLSSQEPYTPDYPFSCVVQSTPRPQDLYHHFKYFTVSSQSLSSTQSPLALFLFFSSQSSCPNILFLLPTSQKAPIWILPLQFHQMALT